MIAIRKTLLGLAATATLAAGIAPASATVAMTPQAALAAPVAHDGWDGRGDGGWNHGGRGDWRGRDDWRGGGYGRGPSDYRGDYRGYDRGYDRGYYGDVAYRGQSWRGNDGRYYCRRNDGTTGLLVGGVAGALIGQGVAGRGDRTLGAILGAAGGALLGRSIDQSNARCR
ncbi:glycine zipper 2TM domain-containing protein [Novosphingobium rhizosphaerae]|uniref:glycine zipper 2TM domain-containing protein n=1 Tax=Novosphingobium rhizosphaerae TaxID=1551649 RepID=UPI0017985545